MTALFYYSIHAKLTENEILEIDKQVFANRLFFKELRKNPKRKLKRIGVYILFIFEVGQPLISVSRHVMVPLPPNRMKINRICPIDRIHKETETITQTKSFQIANVIEPQVTKNNIILTVTD